ncbi:zinc-finger domain-containing protein [Pyruvatibacter sp.]|uniref:zinc-finger domain-containing protein n=1 Tax=Pyruvatibacter sp. TaxID=1981328 RepID=UPI0032F038C5
MAGAVVPKFKNDDAVAIIEIGVREFHCTGASAPHDHPHVYLDMGADDEIICPYCSTLYRFKATLEATQSNPQSAILIPEPTGPDRR